MRIWTTRQMAFMSLAIVINIVGGFIALNFKLPIYLDTIGTFFVAFAFGPFAGIMIGLTTGLINGLAFDPISFYFIPVQLAVGLLAGFLYKKDLFKGYRTIISTLCITLTSSMIGSVIATFVFSGVTSSGSSYLVQMLKASGISLLTAVFSTQIFTDLLDKSLSICLALSLLAILKKQTTLLHNATN